MALADSERNRWMPTRYMLEVFVGLEPLTESQLEEPKGRLASGPRKVNTSTNTYTHTHTFEPFDRQGNLVQVLGTPFLRVWLIPGWFLFI